MHWVTSRLQAHSYWKPETPSPLAWKQRVGAMRRLLSAVALLDGSSRNLVRWAASHVVCYMGCAISGKRGTVDFFWRERGQNYRRAVMVSNEHVGGRRQWLHTWHWQHAVDTRASHLLTKVWTWQTPSVRWIEKNTEDVIQPRLRQIDRFFFITRGRRLFTEVLAPDGIVSGLAQVGLFMGDKKAPDEFGAVLQGAIDTWQASVTKRNGGISGRSPYEDVERSCGVTLFVDDVFEKSLLELGTADECEHTVARRMGEVNSALETCGLQSTREFGLQIALGEGSTECGGTRGCHTRSKRTLFRGAVCGASLTGLTALLLHDRDYLRLQRCLEKKLRALMLGTASLEGLDHIRTLSSRQVWKRRLQLTSSAYEGSHGTRALPESPHVMHIFYAAGLADYTSNPTTHSSRAFVCILRFADAGFRP